MKTVITLLFGLFWSFSCIHFAMAETNILKKNLYFLERNADQRQLITNINTRALLSHHLDQYEFYREDKIDVYTFRFVFFSPGKKHKVEVSVGIYPAIPQAEESVLDILNSTSAIHKPGALRGDSLGNSCWYYKNTAGPVTITFIRKNVIVRVFSDDLATAESISRKIDADILSGKNSIELKDHQ